MELRPLDMVWAIVDVEIRMKCFFFVAVVFFYVQVMTE